jgi:hypothetical protein
LRTTPAGARILFSMRHLGSLRIFESALRGLADRGYDLLVLAHRRDSLEFGTAPETLFADVPQIRWTWEEGQRTAWTEVAATVRTWLDYLRYFEPRYADAPRLRMRVGERVPALLRRITEWPVVRTEAGRRALVVCLRLVERALPRQQTLDALMHDFQPDAVLITPLVHLGSNQVEVLRSARAFGTRTALCVASWDHLSSKARIGELPDRVFVWNATQAWEARELHGIPSDRLTVTGAQCYDQWFGRAPIRSRDQFCSVLKLPADRPFLLYACSALYPIAPTEARFVRQWIDEIRASEDPLLRSAGILIRPHPSRLEEWREVDLSDLSDVTLYGSLPIDEHSKEDYFDSLYYSAAVVGLNTSAFLEAAIVGRPVHTIVVPEFSERQEGTLHFHYLLSVGGGALRVARSFEEHRVQLAAAVREPPRPDLNARFVEAFIRPQGLDCPATPLFCEAVGDLLLTARPAPAVSPAWAVPLRLAAWPTFRLLRWISSAEAFRDDWNRKERERRRRQEEHRRFEVARLRAADAKKRERERVRVQTLAARAAAARAKEAERQRVEAEKAHRRNERERAKAARMRQRERAAMRGRIKRGATRWLSRWWPKGEGQAT